MKSGPQGAAHIAIHLLERYGKDSFEFIIDEGGSEIKTMYGATFALPGTAEKVYIWLTKVDYRDTWMSKLQSQAKVAIPQFHQTILQLDNLPRFST